MSNFIMILSLLWPQGEASHFAEKSELKTNVRLLRKISQGLSPKELTESWGKPSRIEKSHNFYSDVDQTLYYYEDAPCQFTFQSCTVTFQDGKIASFRDIKADLLE